MKAKEWAQANGFPNVKLGKGRMPADARAAVEAYVAQGGVLEGYAVVKSKATTEKPSVATVVKTTAATSSGVVDVRDETRNEQLWEASTPNGPIGMRSVCLNCRSSFTYCPCKHPRVYVQNVEVVVVFKPRKNPEAFRANRWW